MKKRTKLLSIVISISLLLILNKLVFKVYVTPTSAMKAALKEADISIDNYYSVKNEDNIFYICHSKDTLIFIIVENNAGILWSVTHESYNARHDSIVNLGMSGEGDFTIVYGLCIDKDIASMQLQLENGDKLEFILDDSRLFAFTYNKDLLYWKELLGYSTSKEVIWSYTN